MADRKKQHRCAIYTRKSSEEGLEQDFNSLDAQREACEAYIVSQRSEGWTLLPDRYDDGGFSGGTLDRPALQTLLADIENGRVDVIVVYKIDRLSRSLMDFARLVEVMDRKNVTFVSVTQSFNTTTSMGRLTLNILLSFAQFEREVTGERIRDKIGASKRKGMWMGGFVPLGYEARDRTLIINEAEAETVRTIFQLYLASGTVRAVEAETARRGLRTRPRSTGGERMLGGRPFSRGHLYRILSNPLYIGEIAHKGTRYPGQHPAIIDGETFHTVQGRLGANTRGKRDRANATEPSLLSGLLFDEAGNRLSATHAVKSGRRYRYYGTTAQAGGFIRLSASAIEPVVVRQVAGLFRQVGRLIDELCLGTAAPDVQADVMARAERLAVCLEDGRSEDQREILVDLIEKVTVGATVLRIEIGRTPLRTRLVGDEAPAAVESGGDSIDPGTSLLIETPLRIARRGGETILIIEGESGEKAGSPDRALIKAVARGHAWFDDRVSGRARSIREIADREGLTDRYIARLLELAFLPPATVEDILDGTQPVEWTSEMLSRSEGAEALVGRVAEGPL